MSLICLAAGGTGGHVFPAASLAQALQTRGHGVHVLTDARGQAYMDAMGSAPITQIAAGALVGKSLLDRIRALGSLLRGIWQARRTLAQVKPDLVVGFGGYPSVPPLIAAWSLGIPSILHEQNAVMGLANRLASRFASKVALSFENTLRQSRPAKAQVVGNPVREAFVSLPRYEAPKESGAIHVLVFGGSQGAQIMADLVPAAVASLPGALRMRLHLTLQLRAEDAARARDALYEANLAGLDIQPFLSPMTIYMAQAHLILARSGATTVCEVAVAGRPALFIPLALHADAQQARNAKHLVDAGGAQMLLQQGLTSDELAKALQALLTHPSRLADMAQAAHRVAHPHAAENLADLALQIVNARP